MNKRTLNPAQSRTVAIIRALGFGVIQGLSIRGGQPCSDPAPRIVQHIKLDSEPERRPDPSNPDCTVQNEFEILFRHLRELGECIVDIEVRHGLPFRLIVERSWEELV